MGLLARSSSSLVLFDVQPAVMDRATVLGTVAALMIAFTWWQGTTIAWILGAFAVVGIFLIPNWVYLIAAAFFVAAIGSDLVRPR